MYSHRPSNAAADWHWASTLPVAEAPIRRFQSSFMLDRRSA
jgi:hypothetical protein